MKIEDVAKVCHEANRALCESFGDFSQKPWEDSPDWQKESAVAGIRALIEKPDMTPSELHDKWCLHKISQGWTFGPIKDAERKTHPCLVSYGELPKNEQAKDKIFRAIVFKMLMIFDLE